uniref:Uncharacterized protein n=1 Tax=Arundo donax TaxID=35708 RepID=A0A0A9HDK6_ARUDO
MVAIKETDTKKTWEKRLVATRSPGHCHQWLSSSSTQT